MDFNEYQELAFRTASYPNKGSNIYYPALGLGEAGEVQGKVKKVMRDNDGVLTDEFKHAIIDEMGDVLWYIAALSSELQTDLSEVAKRNIAKLEDRRKRGKIGGSGDYR